MTPTAKSIQQTLTRKLWQEHVKREREKNPDVIKRVVNIGEEYRPGSRRRGFGGRK